MRKVLAGLLTLTLAASWALVPGQSELGAARAQSGAPRFDRLRPTTITSGAPTFTVRLEGKRFAEGAQVLLDGAPLPSSRVAGTSILLAEIDSSVVAAPGTHTIQAANPDGMMTDTKTLTVVAPDPELRIQFDQSNAAEEDQPRGLVFPIRGEGFGKGTKVIVWGKAADSNFIDEDEIEGLLNASLTDNPARIPVLVRTKSGKLSNVQIFFVFPRPATIDTVDPDVVEVGTEDFEIKVLGDNFRPDAKLIVNGQVLEITTRKDGRLEAMVPGAFRSAPGLLSVRVQQDGIQSKDLAISVAPSEDPFIFTIAPVAIRQNEDRETIDIIGANLRDSDVLLDGEEASVRSSTRRRLTIVVKKELLANLGSHTLQVKDKDGNVSNLASFSVVPDVEVSTLVGTSRDGFNPEVTCVSAEEARLRRPRRVTLGPDGLIYVTDQHNHAIRTINPDTGEVCTLAGTGVFGYNDTGNPRDFPITFSFPNGIAVAPNGDIFVTENGNLGIRLLRREGGQITASTFAGRFREITDDRRQDKFKSTRLGENGYFDGPVSQSAFNLPDDIVIAADGTIYVADANNHAIRRIRHDGSTFVVDTLAGNGVPGFADGMPPNARFNTPTGLALSLDGAALFVADTNNNRVRKVDLATGLVSTAAGSGDRGSFDGPAIESSFFQPIGLAVGSDGTLFISDVTGNRIRRLDTSGNVTTVAGDDSTKFRDGPGLRARFNSPRGLFIDRAKGIIYVADTEDFRIRMIDLP